MSKKNRNKNRPHRFPNENSSSKPQNLNEDIIVNPLQIEETPEFLEPVTKTEKFEEIPAQRNDVNVSWLRIATKLSLILILLFIGFLTFRYLSEQNIGQNETYKRIADTVSDAINNSGNKGKPDISSGASTKRDEVIKDSGTNNGQIAEWHATNYKKGDINKGKYTVKEGDTLWEISEAVNGNGAQWTQILSANQGSIGYLPNGSQALIVPGQVLLLN